MSAGDAKHPEGPLRQVHHVHERRPAQRPGPRQGAWRSAQTGWRPRAGWPQPGEKRGRSSLSLTEEAAESRSDVFLTTPKVKIYRSSTSEDVDIRHLDGASKEILSVIIKRAAPTTAQRRAW